MKFVSQLKYTKGSEAKNTIKSYLSHRVQETINEHQHYTKQEGIISCSKYGIKALCPLFLHLQKECDCLKH